jgi:hypothetical protein
VQALGERGVLVTLTGYPGAHRYWPHVAVLGVAATPPPPPLAGLFQVQSFKKSARELPRPYYGLLLLKGIAEVPRKN